MHQTSGWMLFAVLTLALWACGSSAEDEVALCEAAERYDAAGDAVIEAVARADDDEDRGALLDPTAESLDALQAISHELDAEEAGPFTRIAAAQERLVESLRGDPPDLPDGAQVPQQVYDEARLILIDRCGVDVAPTVPGS